MAHRLFPTGRAKAVVRWPRTRTEPVLDFLLPFELWENVFRFCAARGDNLLNVSLACRFFRGVAESERARNVSINPYLPQWLGAPFADDVYSRIENADVSFCRFPTQEVFESAHIRAMRAHLHKLTQLRSLQLTPVPLVGMRLFKVLRLMPQLERLHIDYRGSYLPEEEEARGYVSTLIFLSINTRDVSPGVSSPFGALLSRLVGHKLEVFTLQCAALSAEVIRMLALVLEGVKLRRLEIALRASDLNNLAAHALNQLLAKQSNLKFLCTGPGLPTCAWRLLSMPVPRGVLPELRIFNGRACEAEYIIPGRPVQKVYLQDLDAFGALDTRQPHFPVDPEELERRMWMASSTVMNVGLSTTRPILSLRLEFADFHLHVLHLIFSETAFQALEDFSIEVADTYPYDITPEEGHWDPGLGQGRRFFDDWLPPRLANMKHLKRLAFDEVDEARLYGRHKERMGNAPGQQDWAYWKSRVWQGYCPTLREVHLFDYDCVRISGQRWESYPCWIAKDGREVRRETVRFWKEF